MRARALIALAVVIVAATTLTSCGLKPPQDYVVTGTLDASKELRRTMRQPIFDELTRYATELRMTVRTTPDVGDVVAQRRWRNVGMPHEFGLGKGRGEAIRATAGKVYVTAMLTLRDPRSGAPLARFVGWTPKPVAVGTYNTHLMLEWMASRVDPSLDGFPAGGWWSPTVREEAMPPGLEKMVPESELRPPGSRVFAGTIDVSDSTKRGAVMGCTLFIQARTRRDRSAPELIVRYDDPVFPFSFAMHENQRFFGDPVPVEEMDPLYVIAILDRDGSVDSKDDQVRIVTDQPVAPETFDLKLVLDLSDAPDALFGTAASAHPMPGGGAGGDAAGPPAGPRGRGEHLVSGRVILPGDLAADVRPKSMLWMSLRDAATDELIFVTRVAEPTFPQDFELHAGDNKFGGTVAIERPFKVKAILTDGPVMKTGPGVFIGISDAVAKGETGLDVVLERSE